MRSRSISRDTEILGPLPLPRGVIIRAKVVGADRVRGGIRCRAECRAGNDASGLRRSADCGRPCCRSARSSRLTSSSTTAAAAFGFAVVLGLRELLHAVLGTAGFRRISVVVRAALVVALVTTLLLIPAMAFRVANLWLQGAIDAKLLPPMWFAGLHDMMSGHVWAQLPRPDLPPSVAVSERAFEFMYQSRRPLLRELGLAGGGMFLLVLFASAVAYLWNNRRLPDPPVSRTAERGHVRSRLDAIALRVRRTAAPRSRRTLLHHARPRAQRSEPPLDRDSARESRSRWPRSLCRRRG